VNGVVICSLKCRWAGLSAEEICKSVVKEKKPPPQYSRVVGVGLPGELWKMIGECLQFRASRRPSFQDMLKTFLRHLLDIPRSPPASPEM
jgi:E3 ubiquitin-protein ligase KEG